MREKRDPVTGHDGHAKPDKSPVEEQSLDGAKRKSQAGRKVISANSTNGNIYRNGRGQPTLAAIGVQEGEHSDTGLSAVTHEEPSLGRHRSEQEARRIGGLEVETRGAPEKCNVLVVEDSATLRQMVSMALDSRGYRVWGAPDGITALHSLAEHLPDAIVLDLNLPDIDGFELCKRMKSEPRSRNIPVLVMTGLDQPGFEIMAIEAGADDFIAKPVDPLVLDARIQMVVRRMRRERFANALTGLPGNALTEERLAFCLARRKPFAAVFVDIDGFKPFNRRYGYARGDLLLRSLSGLILESLQFARCEEPFVGHMGGDDFVVICEPDRAKDVADQVAQAFDLTVMDFYEDEDRDRGHFVLADRSGELREYGPLTLSIAIVPVIESFPDSVITLIDAGNELKDYAHTQSGSTVMTERRAEPGPR